MFGLGPQEKMKMLANRQPPETNEVENPVRPKASQQADTTSETSKLNTEGTQVDLENNKEANIGDANLNKEDLKKNSGQADTKIEGDEKLGWFATMKNKIKNNVKNRAMDEMSVLMGGKGENSGGEGKATSLDNSTAPGENRPNAQELPQPDKTRPKPRVPGTEGIVENPKSMQTPVTGHTMDLPKTSVPKSGFSMPSVNKVMPKMPRIG